MNEQEGPVLIPAVTKADIKAGEEAAPDVAKQILAVAQAVDSVKIPPQGISRRQFLNLVPGIAALPFAERKPGSASAEPSLPLPVVLAIPPLLAFVNRPGLTTQQRERCGCIALAIVGTLLAATPLALYGVSQGGRIAGKAVEDLKFLFLPPDQQAEVKRRQEAEKSPAYSRYKEGVYLVAFGPFDIDHPIVQQLFGEIGPTWMFTPERKNELKQWFGRDFTDREIEQFRINPKKVPELMVILKTLQEQGKISQPVVDFYSRPREQILRELQEKYKLK